MSHFRNYRPNEATPIVRTLIITNVLVWLAQLAFDRQYDLTDKLALHPVTDTGFKAYQILTHMFAHASYNSHIQPYDGGVIIYHILFNMLSLWIFGRALEMIWSGKRFFNFYIICGIGAGLFHLLVQHFTGGYSTAVGASGAVMGLLAAFAYLFPNTKLYVFLIPFPVKAKWAVIAMVAIDLFGGIAGVQGDNIAHFAHLGGAITGFIIVLFWNRTNRKQFY